MSDVEARVGAVVTSGCLNACSTSVVVSRVRALVTCCLEQLMNHVKICTYVDKVTSSEWTLSDVFLEYE